MKTVSNSARQNRLMWREAKKRAAGFVHIKIGLSGDKDTAKCLLCGFEREIEVPGRKRESLVLLTARTHFYKHKLDRKQVEEN